MVCQDWKSGFITNRAFTCRFQFAGCGPYFHFPGAQETSWAYGVTLGQRLNKIWGSGWGRLFLLPYLNNGHRGTLMSSWIDLEQMSHWRNPLSHHGLRKYVRCKVDMCVFLVLMFRWLIYCSKKTSTLSQVTVAPPEAVSLLRSCCYLFE